MKKIFLFAFLAFIAAGLYSFRHLENRYNDIFQQLGLGTEEAESYITANIIGESTSFPRSAIMASLALNKREEAVKQIGNYLKAYTQTPAFAKEYATARQDQKPEPITDPLYNTAEFMAEYKKDIKRWEALYPATVNDLLKRKLKEFLQLTSDIDYGAKLEQRGNKKVFSDPTLEMKDAFWKACFRSGKPTVMAARAFAQQWLLELK